MSPKFLAVTFQTAKSPIFLETLTVSQNEELNTSAINEVLDGNKDIILEKYLGIQKGIFKNKMEDINDILSIQDVFRGTIEFIEKLDF